LVGVAPHQELDLAAGRGIQPDLLAGYEDAGVRALFENRDVVEEEPVVCPGGDSVQGYRLAGHRQLNLGGDALDHQYPIGRNLKRCFRSKPALPEQILMKGERP
jgi:hypothetical protein